MLPATVTPANAGSIHLIVRADVVQHDQFFSADSGEIEYYPHIVTSAAGPQTRQFSFQLVGSQVRSISIFAKGPERRADFFRSVGMLVKKSP